MIDNYFTEALRTLPSDGNQLALAADGAVKIELDGVEMTFVVPETASEVVYCRTCVGATDGLDTDALSLALLADNYMWQATSGATLSIRDGSVYLSDRRDDVEFESSEALADYIARFASTVRMMRTRLETFRKTEGGAE